MEEDSMLIPTMQYFYCSICTAVLLVLTWGMMVILERRSWRPIWAMLIPSIKIRPFAASRIRKIPKARDDFPAPVLPTIPTCKFIIHYYSINIKMMSWFIYNSGHKTRTDNSKSLIILYIVIYLTLCVSPRHISVALLWIKTYFTFSLSWMLIEMLFKAQSRPLRYCSP